MNVLIWKISISYCLATTIYSIAACWYMMLLLAITGSYVQYTQYDDIVL